jgi:hypothetical protein
MSTSSPHPHKPGDHSAYASIRSPQGSSATEAAQAASTPTSTTSSTSSSGFSAELAKLQEMRDALWEAFKAGPEAGFPTILIDLTNSYANSLRIQLNMKGLSIRKSANAGQTVPPGKATAKG